MAVRVADEQFSLGDPAELPPPAVVPVLPEVIEIMSSQYQWGAERPRNWLNLDYRLAFISEYFAAVQQDPDATSEPPYLALSNAMPMPTPSRSAASDLAERQGVPRLPAKAAPASARPGRGAPDQDPDKD